LTFPLTWAASPPGLCGPLLAGPAARCGALRCGRVRPHAHLDCGREGRGAAPAGSWAQLARDPQAARPPGLAPRAARRRVPMGRGETAAVQSAQPNGSLSCGPPSRAGRSRPIEALNRADPAGAGAQLASPGWWHSWHGGTVERGGNAMTFARRRDRRGRRAAPFSCSTGFGQFCVWPGFRHSRVMVPREPRRDARHASQLHMVPSTSGPRRLRRTAATAGLHAG